MSWKGKWNLLRSSPFGTVIGILPAAGGAIASLVAYAEARRASGTPERFGRGEPNGVLATESANNATVGTGCSWVGWTGVPSCWLFIRRSAPQSLQDYGIA